MKPRGAELALVWIAKENGKPWREPREAWKREQPEDRPYGSEREFARDVRNAYRDVVGDYKHARERDHA